jgi:hypothetical protein
MRIRFVRPRRFTAISLVSYLEKTTPSRSRLRSEPRASASGVLGGLLVSVALVCCLLACRSSPVAHAVDTEAASCVPAGTIVLAGVDLERLRAAPIYAKLPPAAVALAGSLSAASSVLLAYDGKDLLAIARGDFASAPPGAVLAAPNLALFGPPELAAAAMAQHRSHASGSPALVVRAESIAAGKQIWIVMQGGSPLPLSGNAENLNHLIRNTDSIAITATIDSGLALAITAIGRSASAARGIEETVRAEITLAAAAVRQPDLAKLLRSIQIDRDDRAVRITVSADADAAAKLIAALAP